MISDGIIALIGVLSVVDLILVCKVYKIFTEITNNQNELLYLLRDEVNEIKKYMLPPHVNVGCTHHYDELCNTLTAEDAEMLAGIGKEE